MKEYLFVYRNDYKSQPNATPEEGKLIMQKWMDWLGGIGKQGKLIDQGNVLGSAGKVVKAGNMVTDGPYTEIKELIGGYSLVKTETIEEATQLAKGCPILESGGNVEVREINKM